MVITPWSECPVELRERLRLNFNVPLKGAVSLGNDGEWFFLFFPGCTSKSFVYLLANDVDAVAIG